MSSFGTTIIRTEIHLADNIGSKYGRKATLHGSLPGKLEEPSVALKSMPSRNATNDRLWLSAEVGAWLIDFRSYSDNRHCCGGIGCYVREIIPST